jgi:hypothetical protein
MNPSLRYDIPSTPVTYKGKNFLSWLEGKWAMVFEELEIPWEYEAPVVYLGLSLGWYRSDFWLPDHKTLIEVKGPPPTENELEKLRALWDYHDQNVTCAILREIPGSAAEFHFPSGHLFPANKGNLLLLLADNDSARLTAAYTVAKNYHFIRTNLDSEQEIERLKAENERMKAEIERLSALAQGSQTAEYSDKSFSLDHVIAAWPSILDDVKQSDKRFYSVLRDVKPVQVDGLLLTLQAKSDFHLKKVEKDFRLLETVVRKRFGLNITIHTTQTPPTRVTPSPDHVLESEEDIPF